MIYAIEAPYVLHDVISYTDYDYLLAHLVEESSEYVDFYLKQKETGRFSILDNSVFELGEAVSDEMLIRCLEITRADELIIPDVLHNAEETYKRAMKFLEHYDYIQELGADLFAVAQGDTLENFLDCFRLFSSNEKIKTIGIPFDLELKGVYEGLPKDERQMWTRLMVTTIITLEKLYNPEKNYHLLGVSLPRELTIQKLHGWIRSCDTSAPVMAAVVGVPIFEVQSKLHRIKNYFEDRDIANMRQAIINSLIEFKKGISREKVSNIL